jgi:ABC-type lipoprotein export system ATPase subunit
LRSARCSAFHEGVKDSPLIAIRDVSCARMESDAQMRVEVPSLAVQRGTVTLLAGGTGCGKNLLLRLLGLLEAPDSGEVWFEGQPTAQMTDDTRATLRTRKCGYVFASPFLLSSFTVLENIAMPIFKVCQLNPEQARDRTEDLMDFTGLGDLASAHEVPPPMQHRVALARALASQPAAIFVENLDTLLPVRDLEPFRELLHGAAKRYDVAVVATALSLSAREGERRIELSAGRLVSQAQS